MRNRKTLSLFLSASIAVVAGAGAGCAADSDDFDLSEPLSPVPIADEGKDDGAGQPAIAVNTDVSDTEVWKVRHMWEETDETPESQAEGIAWPAHSHLTWDQKYSAWITQLRKIPTSTDGTGDTYELLTPYGGKTIAAPSLECAEVAMFQRAVFAAWYGLPFFLEARDRNGARIFIGHFGARTATGRWGNSPQFPKYKDYTSSWKPGDAWPTDSNLRKVALDGGSSNSQGDPQPAVGKDAHFGAYADEVFLNKRAGYFLAYLLDNFYSGSLADPVNTYNVRPEALRAGDVLIRRWQRNGIGHTMVIKQVNRMDNGLLMANIIQGGMPRHQGEWTDEVEAKSSLTTEDAGGDGATYDTPAIPFWKLGGGIKRFRVARSMGGFWVNTYMPIDKGNWISSNDPTHLVPRPKHFGDILGEVPAPQKRDSLLATIAAMRLDLSKNPSSCTDRQEREKAMDKLRNLADQLGTTQDKLLKDNRKLEDYVFTPLDYQSSKTCCWDSSSPQMYRVIMDYAQEEQNKATAQKTCVQPTVFRARKEVPAGYTGLVDGYQLWRDWATHKGRAAEWIDAKGQPAKWSEDETCDQRATADDSESYIEGATYCDIFGPPAATTPNPPTGTTNNGTSPDPGQ